MTTRGARAERHANLRLLESVRTETDEKRKRLEDKYAAMPILSAEQAEEVAGRILAMSLDAVLEFFQSYRLRMAGDNAWSHYYLPPRDPRHEDDPEMAAAVERVNVALNEYDDASLNLRVVELFGGRVPPIHAPERAEWDFSTFFTLDMFGILVSAGKTMSYYEALAGKDVFVAEREVFQQLLLPATRARCEEGAQQKAPPCAIVVAGFDESD